MTFKRIASLVINRMYVIDELLSQKELTSDNKDKDMDGNLTNQTLDSEPILTVLTVEVLVLVILVVILGIWIIILNCILIHTLVRRHAHLEVTDIFIYSLGITDAIVGILILYNSAYNVFNFQNKTECLIRFGLIQFMLLNSTGHIALLTIDRYVKISFPYFYQRMFQQKPILIASAFIWIVSFVIGSLPVLGWNTELPADYNEGKETVCRYFGVMSPHFIMLNVGLFWVPLILMAVMYSHMCKIARKHVHDIRASTHLEARKDAGMYRGQSWKFTKTVFIIMGVYVFCWMPTGIFLMLQVSGTLNHLSLSRLGDILTLVTTTGFVSCLFNPIIYATKIPFVKKRFKEIFCCGRASDPNLNNNSPYTVSIKNDAFVASVSETNREVDLKIIE